MSDPFISAWWDEAYELVSVVFHPADGSRHHFKLDTEECLDLAATLKAIVEANSPTCKDRLQVHTD